jgi:hypothetical protein
MTLEHIKTRINPTVGSLCGSNKPSPTFRAVVISRQPFRFMNRSPKIIFQEWLVYHLLGSNESNKYISTIWWKNAEFYLICLQSVFYMILRIRGVYFPKWLIIVMVCGCCAWFILCIYVVLSVIQKLNFKYYLDKL